MFSFFKRRTVAEPLKFYNTLGKELQEFTIIGKEVRMYNCGPTVYGPQHIGNLSAAVFADTLRRTLEFNGHKVKQVINITDFGHLTSDADEGEDKMSKGLRATKKAFTMENMLALGTQYMNQYLAEIATLNVLTEEIEFPRASDYVPAQIALIKTLEEKGYAYDTKDGVYFETRQFPTYGILGGISTDDSHARIEESAEKRGPSDFALWKKTNEKTLGWDSPWGRGFPGWHIECSAMILSILGKQIDIHTGGIEHVSIHHNNEIAQAEAATGRSPFSRFWLHREHIQLNDAKLAKSDGNVVYLSDLTGRGIDPLALRYWFLTAHYRTASNFTWEALEASASAYKKLHKAAASMPHGGSIDTGYTKRFTEAINNDLGTPQALALIWELLKDSEVRDADKRATIVHFDTVLGLNLEAAATSNQADIPVEIQALLEARKEAREKKDWQTSDALRDELKLKGYTVSDSGTEQTLSTR